MNLGAREAMPLDGSTSTPAFSRAACGLHETASSHEHKAAGREERADKEQFASKKTSPPSHNSPKVSAPAQGVTHPISLRRSESRSRVCVERNGRVTFPKFQVCFLCQSSMTPKRSTNPSLPI